MSGECVSGPSTESHVPTKKAPKSFLSFRKSKGKEWKSLVSKSDPGGKKRKEADVVVYIGLMEWNENSGSLKPKRGKKLALRTSPLSTYSVLRPDAEEKWKKFHSNLYDSSESYHLLYEDGTRALFLPGPEKELFTLKRYQEEIGKDFKRITLFLCTDHDLKKSEGHCESTDSSEEPIFEKTSVPLPAEMPPSSSSGDVEVETACSKEETEAQIALDQQVASELQELYDAEVDGNDCISNGCVEEKEVDSSSIVKEISKKVDQSHQFFIITRRGAPLQRVLGIWRREASRNPSSVNGSLRVNFMGENGIDSGALSKEFLSDTVASISSVMFPNGSPINSTFHIQNGNFSACGQIIATSLAQGGPAPSFLDESVYNIMVDPDVDVKKLDEKHLTENDLQLIQSIRESLSSHHETIIDHGYTGTIDEAHMDEIVNSVIISIIVKRVAFLKEFLEGLKLFGVADAIKRHPQVCKSLFTRDSQSLHVIDANYLISLLRPEYSPKGSTRQLVEESLMDYFQDFVYNLEDDKNICGFSEALAWNEDQGVGSVNLEPAEQFSTADLTPAGVMGWLTGQKHKPLNGEILAIAVRFNHDCMENNPSHTICFPIVGACAKEITLPVAHMRTQKEFSDVFLMAFCKGQAFGNA